MKLLNLLAFFLTATLFAQDRNYFQSTSKLHHLIQAVETQEISSETLILEVDETDIDLLIKPSVEGCEHIASFASGQGVCSGAVQGVLCFDLKNIQNLKETSNKIIWVTDRISNDDLCHLKDVDGIFALKEDPSSHAVIVTRVHNIPCITFPKETIRNGSQISNGYEVLLEGDLVTLDGFNGKLFKSALPIRYPNNPELLSSLMHYADMHAKIQVHGSLDTATEAIEALKFGAKGADPRTEHMFFSPNRLKLFRKAILTAQNSHEALSELGDMQKKDFIDLYQVMKNYPIKIRLLDPPLHEFLPVQESHIEQLAEEIGISIDQLQSKIEKMEELNPMMGHRGIRLLLTHPEILKMQVRAIFEAALDPTVADYNVEPHIILPMVICAEEVASAKKIIDQEHEKICKLHNKPLVYHLGAMIETPRACLLAETIAPFVDFISFGTNDLTGQTLALSRGDVYEKFLKFYFENNLLYSDPFANLDPAVCALIKTTVQQMRNQNHPITIGLCGEQGSGKEGVFRCHELGLDTVSCSAYRIPAVRLFSAQAAILLKK